MIGLHFGWTGGFTRETYPGALPSGTRIVKVRTEPGDLVPIGANGTVLGSVGHSSLKDIAYFVEWDDRPKHAVATIDWKIAPL